MPVYEYENELTGERCERFVPMAARDRQPGLQRVFVPCTFAIPGSALDEYCMESMERGMRQGLKQMEEKDLLPKKEWSKGQFKRIWEDN